MAVLDDRAVDLRAENAELRRRLDEALAQQQATAEILQLINASPGDLAPVFDAMLEKATTLCDAPSGQLAIYDGEFFRFVAAHGDAAHVHDLLARGTMLPVSGTTWPRIVAGELVVHIPDVMESEHYRAGHENTRRFVEVSGGRSLLTVALRKDNVLMGALSVYRRHAQPFAEKQIALLQNFAAQAVIAMESARLFGELRERTADLQESLEYQTATSDVLKVISRTEAKLEAALETLVGTAARICAADQGAIHQLHDGLHFVSASFGTNPEYRDYVARNPIAPGRGTAIGRMALEGRVVHIEDVLRDPEYTGSEFQRLAGFRTVLAVPLFREDVVIGSILLTRSRVEPFTGKQIELVRTFADQAVIAIENTRLITETREALEQQTATAEVLGVINSSPGDLAPVFDAMLEKAMRLCDASMGVFTNFDGNRFKPRVSRGVPPRYAEYLATTSDQPSPDGTNQRVLAGENVAQVTDLMEAMGYRTGHPWVRALVELGDARTLVTVALRKDAALLGTITLYRREVRSFSNKEIALLDNFGAQAVIAMENARLITETREALEQQTATAEVLGVINSSPGDLAPVFDAMVERAVRLCEADEAAVRTFDGEVLDLAAAHGEPRIFEQLRQLGPSHVNGLYEPLTRGEAVIHIADVRDTEAYRDIPRARERLDLRGIRSWLAVALRKDGALLGVINVHRRELRPFTDKQIALLQNFAAQAVIAMENARLITETREALEQQTATAEVLRVINSSPGDLAPVFDAILEKAHRLCGAAKGALVTFDGTRLRGVATRGLSESYAEIVREQRDNPLGSPPDRLLRGERFVHIEDFASLDLPIPRAAFELEGVRTVLFVPLRKDAALLGYITAYRQEVRPFSDKQIALLQNFAAQAVIAMENARLITETREALEQQTATAEVLGVINSSPGDLAPVFDAMLDKAMDLCGAAFGALMSYDGETVAAVATRGLPPELADLFRAPIAPRREGDAPYARFLRGEPLLHILDMAADDVLPSLASRPRALVDIGGARTGLEIPLRKEGTLRGSIWLYRKEVRPFTDKEIALLQNFAAQAVIAMENARLITETREALEQQTATAEVLGVINSSPGDLAPVFDAMLEKAMRLCEASGGALRSYDGSAFHAAAMRGVPAAFVEATQIVVPDPDLALGRIERGAHIIQVPDLTDTKLSQANAQRRRELLDLGGIRTALWVALRKDDALLGVFVLYRDRVQPFTDKQIALVENFAAQAVIAMENARLITETREALEQQTATAEVLGVINSSPGDLAPVFEAIVEKARRLSGAAFGALRTFDGELFHLVAAHGGEPDEIARLYELGPIDHHNLSANGHFARLVQGEKVVHIADMHELDGYRTSTEARERIDLRGIRTLLAVALTKDDTLLGVIVVHRQEVRPFSGQEIRLIENFADQAVIAMENARLITETREALEQQTATAEVLGVINYSPGDLAPVFDSMLEKAHTLCGAALGSLVLYDGSHLRGAATRGYPEEYADLVREGGPASLVPAFEMLLNGEPIVHVPDAAAAPMTTPIARAAVEVAGVRTMLLVPLQKDGAVLGYISAQRQHVQPFTDKQIALLENFAAQAVIAMENARLLGELRQRTDEVAELNRGLEARVAEQVEELGRVGKLKRFLAPQLAELIVSQGDENILESHRREIVVVFCDLRGFTAFAETAEPEEVLDLLREYHAALGPLVGEFEGTLDHFSGDGIMVFFNDPVPCPDPAERAVNMAVAMRAAANELVTAWRRRGRDLGFGVGIAQGYATLGQIGFADRSDYTAIGTVCNLAARLCAEAKDGQILLARRVAAAVEGTVALEELGTLSLKGLAQPVAAFNVLADGAAV